MAEDAIPPAVQRRLEELEQKVRTLERQQEVSEEVRTADKAKQTAAVSAGTDGFALKSTDGAFQLKLRGLLHADSRWFFDSDNPTSDDTFTLRRARPFIEGTVFNLFDFRFMPDFAGGRTVIQDAYVDARFLPWLQIKAGKFKTPFGIERLQSASAIRFVERALPNNLVPNRDIGGELHSELGGGVFSYSLAGLNGVNDGRSSDDIGDIDNNVDKDFAGRIFAHPFLNTSIVALQGLGIGFGTSYVDAEALPTPPICPTTGPRGSSGSSPIAAPPSPTASASGSLRRGITITAPSGSCGNTSTLPRTSRVTSTAWPERANWTMMPGRWRSPMSSRVRNPLTGA